MAMSPPLNPGRRLEPTAAYAVGFLLLGVALVVAAATMYSHRVGCRFQLAPCSGFGSSVGTRAFAIERSLFAASVIATVIGLGMVSEVARGTRGLEPAKAGAGLYAFGGLLIVARELALVGGDTFPHSIVVGYVVLAFLGQTLAGWGLMRGLVGLKGVGGATVVWNLGLLLVFSLTIPNDMHIPIVHNVMPAAIAAALLIRRQSPERERLVSHDTASPHDAQEAGG